ncbi:MAG: galactokinase [Desulfobacteraceae bacterium]
MNYRKILEKRDIAVSVPCRIDLGGTLDITTFYIALARLKPCTFNIAVDMRTRVTLSPWNAGRVKVSSRGFDSAEFPSFCAPYDHPMGLMFAVADFFAADGVHIRIESSSPPKSALGGSSAAAVAIVSAFLKCRDGRVDPQAAAVTAHHIEAGVAGVPCGFQDQLAAAFGGVNVWHWQLNPGGPGFVRKKIFTHREEMDELDRHMLVAYCGVPHVSKDVNKKWVNGFISGENRDKWEEISVITGRFSEAVQARNFFKAGVLMNQETELRLAMTPDVLDATGRLLYGMAVDEQCGARFTGAGGGGCVWAIGETGSIDRLKKGWKDHLAGEEGAELLNTRADTRGILFLDPPADKE